MAEENSYDCIIVGAGPGGLQAAIYLGRFSKEVLLIDRGGGRTWHARHIENFLTQKVITGKEIIERGIEQARSFGVTVMKGLVTAIEKKGGLFEVSAGEAVYRAPFVIVSSGAQDNLPSIENLFTFFGTSIYTCVDCDGYRTRGKKLVIIGNSIKSADLALAMKRMYTDDITLVLYTDKLPDDYKEELKEERIRLVISRPVRVIGEKVLEGVELQDGTTVACEAIMSHFGFKLNDAFLSGLDLKKDAQGFKYVVSAAYESSLSGLYIVGPLNTGNDQVVIAAGEGAVAAIDINKRLLQM
ncbi:MAG: NAD(P)/FAD-dependent oxidoreductase [Nitrospirota bacterium]